MRNNDAGSASANGNELAQRSQEFTTSLAALANNLRGLGKRLTKSLSKDDTIDILATLKSVHEEVFRARELSASIEALRKQWTAVSERRFLELEADLRESCAGLGWHIGGQWPTLYVSYAVPVEIDEAKRSVQVGGKKIVGGLREIVEALKPAVSGLIPEGFSSRGFIEDIASAYDDVGASQAPILAVYRALVIRMQRPRFWRDARTGSFVGMSTEQFRARLTRLLEDGAVTTKNGRDLRLLPPLTPTDAIYVYQPAESRFGYIGRIEFQALPR